VGVFDWLANRTNANVNTIDDEGWTLHFAANGGALAMVMWLVNEVNANVNATAKNGWTPLQCAAAAGHYRTKGRERKY
jgi:ankyrin repeat protein